MHALHSVQSAFYAAVVADSLQPLQSMLVEEEDVARRRLAAYTNNFIGTLSAALEASYPVVARIVGAPFFREAARQFVLTTPSASGDLNEYGEGFGEFLAAYRHAQHLAYLPDVARMEWLVQQVYYAADTPAADLGVLAHFDETRCGELCFSVTQAHARMNSRWPLADIWRVNQPAFDGDMALDLTAGAHILIMRRHGLVYVEAMSAGEAVLFDLLADHQTLAAATGRALATDPDFNLAAALNKLVGTGLLWQARLAGEPST